jgi:hypothetical protein
MNISLKSEYALQAVFDLANQNSSEPVKIADIAHRQKIPQKFLELILAGLKQGGFVESRRGAEGEGICLIRLSAYRGHTCRRNDEAPQPALRENEFDQEADEQKITSSLGRG